MSKCPLIPTLFRLIQNDIALGFDPLMVDIHTRPNRPLVGPRSPFVNMKHLTGAELDPCRLIFMSGRGRCVHRVALHAWQEEVPSVETRYKVDSLILVREFGRLSRLIDASEDEQRRN